MSETLKVSIVITCALMTWYSGDYTPGPHSAYWQGETPIGAPEIVTTDYPGVAASVDYPFGTILKFTRMDNGLAAFGVVLDRRRRNGRAYAGYFDAWPALANHLGFGPEFGDQDVGVVPVRVELFDQVQVVYPIEWYLSLHR